MNLSKLQSEVLSEFGKKFIYNGGFTDEDDAKLSNSLRDEVEQFLSDQIQKAYSKGREEVLDMANDELNQVINNKTIKYPPKYGVRLPNRPIPMEEQMFMCEEVAWRRVIEKLSIQSKGKIK